EEEEESHLVCLLVLDSTPTTQPIQTEEEEAVAVVAEAAAEVLQPESPIRITCHLHDLILRLMVPDLVVTSIHTDSNSCRIENTTKIFLFATVKRNTCHLSYSTKHKT